MDDAALGQPPAQYHWRDSQRYEWIGEVEAKPDRLIAYRGRRLHSGNIPDASIPENPVKDGRLTITGFIVAS